MNHNRARGSTDLDGLIHYGFATTNRRSSIIATIERVKTDPQKLGRQKSIASTAPRAVRTIHSRHRYTTRSFVCDKAW